MSARPTRRRPRGPARLVLAATVAWVLLLVGAPALALTVTVLRQPIVAWTQIVAQGGLDALGRSVSLAVVAVVAGGVFGTLGGVVLARQRFLGRRLLDAAVDLPLATSPVIVGLAFVVLWGRGGWLAPVADALGVKVLFAAPGLALATVFVTLPFFVREVALVLDEVGPAEEEAARTLGASGWQVFTRITLPQLHGALRSGTLLSVARALGEFGAVLVVGGAIDGRTQTGTTFVHVMIDERLEPAAHGMALLLGALSVALVSWLPLGARARDEEVR